MRMRDCEKEKKEERKKEEESERKEEEKERETNPLKDRRKCEGIAT